MDHFTALGKASKKMGHDHFMDVPDDKLEALKAMVKRFRAGEEVDESALQASFGYDKYGEPGMLALQDAGRKGASEKTKQNIRAKFSDKEKPVTEGSDGYEPIAHAIEQYITKHYNGKSGLDTDDFMKVASMVRNGSINAARKFASTLDTDPRDKLLSMLGQGVAEGEGMFGRSKYDKRYLDKFDPTEVMNISDDPEMKANRTTRQGSLRTSKKDLEFAFGPPGEDDTWVLEFRNGLVATVYPNPNSNFGMDWFIGGNHPDIEDYVLKAYSAAIDDLEEGLDADQKRVGQLGPTSKVKNNNIGKLVGANENFINTVDQAVVSEMDKSQTPPGRDDDVKGPEGKATPITPKKMADDAKKVLDKQKVKEGQSDLDRILIIMNHRR
jgi:hypothetical protein